MNRIQEYNLNIDELEQKEFYSIIKDIVNNDEFKKLDLYSQHLSTSRFDHSLYVALYTYKMSKSLKLDYVSATRGAMLHDFFLYYWQEENHTFIQHKNLHPQVALKNAKKYFKVNKVMEDCIINHMWPATINKPKTMEGHIVHLADKYSATLEVSKHSYKYVKGKTLGVLAYLTK